MVEAGSETVLSDWVDCVRTPSGLRVVDLIEVWGPCHVPEIVVEEDGVTLYRATLTDVGAMASGHSTAVAWEATNVGNI